jgi:hypothetical protein
MALSNSDIALLADTLRNYTQMSRLSYDELIAAIRDAEARGWTFTKPS